MTLWRIFKKWFLLGLLLIIFFAFFYFDLFKYLNLATVKTYQHTAQQWTRDNYFFSVTIFIAVFALFIACAIPVATIFTLIGGFLFGIPAAFYSTLAMTLGGVTLYYAVRTALGDVISHRYAGWLRIMNRSLQKNAFNFLLFLRLIPVMPCWISNVSAGILNVPLRTFVAATVIGIFPATLILTLVGRGVDELVTAENTISIIGLLRPSILVPLLALAFLSLFPVIYKRFRKDK